MVRSLIHLVTMVAFCLSLQSVCLASGIAVNKEVDRHLLTTPDFVFNMPLAISDSLNLTKAKVSDWIKARIEVAKLQNEMKANASDYDNVVQAFFEERKILLESLNWTVEEFDQVKERIQAAVSAMEIADDLEANKEDHNKEIAEIRANSFYSDQQKNELIAALKEMRNQKKELYIKPTKKDWPAVSPYRETIEKMTAWIAGNTANPPELQE